ncbi:MAG: flavin reductase family protein [Endomicrobiales bacterium]|nr:flavin reductase family protein [Endomicrobiales bacterium]
MFKKVPLDISYRLINHGPCVLVTSGDGIKNNVAPVAWTMPVNDDPPLIAVALSVDHYTTELIRKTGELVVNIPDESMLPSILAAGKSSGRKKDKFSEANLTPQKGEKVKACHVKECAGYLECRVVKELEFDGVALFVCGIMAANAKEGLFDEAWITDKAKTVHHVGGGYFMVSGKRIKKST